MEMKSPTPCPGTVTVRRNPPRKARATPSTNAPQMPVVPSSSSTTTRAIPSFPIQDILSMEIPEKPQNPHQSDPSSSSPKGPISDTIKVYLRIRPLLPPKPLCRNGSVRDQNPRSRAKNAWPQNPAKKSASRDKNAKKKNSGEACVTVSDSHSVTLSPPLALQESKRIKSEVYEGFSYVFPADSPQGEVYERMVKPLVEDFLKGKSGMLAALGPSGSGKTHTVFGSPREPGMVPIALQQIFKQSEGRSESSRSFSISIFEIYSERGKGEKVCDLSPEGTDLSMQQSTIKGLQEVVVSDAGQAESLIACAMLKRATGMTNANSQSSRSQCIINISSVSYKVGEVNNNAVLTIVDLAGAEREKRTGNQGARLLESNFINNTSMVFGLCLRSLLEHQKNPKKPLQKHFQNSLLTKYLRDYLEGKKRMALILTVRAGTDDYLNTSYLLKQASPYMKIKFNNNEESSIMHCNKRHFQALSTVEQPKRMKVSGLEACVFEEGKSIGDEHKLSTEEASRICRLDVSENATKKSDFVDLAEKERNHQIMQNFAKALWNVLKQYKQKLEAAESEIQSLKENLSNEKTRYLELGKELEDLKSCSTCSKGLRKDGSLVKLCTSSESKVDLKGCGSSNIDEKNVDLQSSYLNASYCNGTLEKCGSSPGQDKDVFSQVSNSDVDAANASCFCVENSDQQNFQMGDIFLGNGHNTEGLNEYSGIEDNYSNAEVTDFAISYSLSHGMVRNDSCSSVELDQLLTEDDEKSLHLPPSPKEDVAFTQGCSTVDVPECQPIFDASCKDLKFEKLSRKLLPASSRLPRDCSTLDIADAITEPTELLDPPQSQEEDVTLTKESDVVDLPDIEPRVDVSCKAEKPKRRLAPASSILLRDFTTLDVEDDAEKPKGNRGGRKLAADEKKTTQGRIALLRLLKSDLHL
ncbi:kinesin-like protein KIN-6 isoform X1 [Alnus glutinosa]|uniref:kinesin-like protein KIN-6 isoform X1 n=1 Tax=Alnus glutinosa TaxID=3517 RepID=UPI002D769E69|nr:kinesin-like protein KIN-6 isoform X1 [Alnus glutinosa]